MPAETEPRKRKHKKARKSAEYVEDVPNEEESARALMQMRDGAVKNVRRPSVEYDLAASSQLMNESHNNQRSLSSTSVSASKKRKRGDTRSKKGRKERRPNDSDTLQEENIRPQSRNGTPASLVASQAMDGLDELFEDDQDPPQSSHKLDDINSDDGDVASLLEDYERDEMGSYPFTESHEQSVNNHEEMFASAMPLSSPPPSYSHASAKSQGKRKKKRKRHSAPSSDLYTEEGQASPSGTGQHSFDIDFEAFDDFCAANGVGSANLFDDIPGQALPIDPVLMANDEELAHASNGTAADSEDDPRPTRARDGKLRRVSSGSKRHKHKYAEATDPLVSNSPFFDSFDLLNADQQDQVLPGFEDMQRQSSQEHHRSRASSTDHSHRGHSSDINASKNGSAKSRRKASKPRSTASQHKRKSHLSSPPSEEEAPQGGPYSGTEISKLENYRESYCEEHDISTWKFNELVQSPVRDNPNAKAMWQGAYEILPYRKKTSLRRFCHRRFHNFGVRGAWTAEEDELLEHAVEEKGRSWRAVGQMMGRFEEDVRDRWRNYHINAEYRNKEFWTDAEVRNLVRGVDECMQMMKEARRRALEEKYEGRDLPDPGPDADQDADDMKLINWQIVSDRMGGSRSRLQCSFKWGKLKDADRRRFMKEIRAARRGRNIVEAEKKPPKNPWRMKKALRRVEQMRPGDKQDLLEALSACGALEEGNIPWQSLGDPDFKARWTTVDKKAAWQIMKKNFAGADRMDYQDIVNRLLTTQMAEEDNLGEKYDPEIHGYGEAPPPMTKAEKVDSRKRKMKEKLEKQKKKRKIERANKPAESYKAPGVKSAFFVPESDEDDVDQSGVAMGDQGSRTRSNSNSRRSSDGFGTQLHDGDAEAAETANTSVDEFDEDEFPRSRQVSDELVESLQSLRNA